jgi:hypothetical protein
MNFRNEMSKASKADQDYPLVNLSYEKLLRNKSYLENAAHKYGSLYAFSDTETSGIEIVDPKTGLFNRMLEWSVVFAFKDDDGLFKPVLDKSGFPIVLDEPVNPFIEKQVTKRQKMSIQCIDKSSIDVHGITIEYLFGDSEGLKSRPKLACRAAPFVVVYYALMAMVDFDSFRTAETPVHIVFHNAPFDIKFLNNETDMANLPMVESMFSVVDSLAHAKRIFNESDLKSKTLDSIFEYGKLNYPNYIKDVHRPIHSAIIDSMILLEAFNTLTLYMRDIAAKKIY